MSDKIKYQLEYIIKASENILYTYFSSPSGLSEWFADNVNINGEKYIFFWEGEGEEAVLLTKKNNSHIKFQWGEDEGEDYYFEFRIKIDPMTKDVALIVTDFAEEDEKEEAVDLWDKQISDLRMKIGG